MFRLHEQCWDVVGVVLLHNISWQNLEKKVLTQGLVTCWRRWTNDLFKSTLPWHLYNQGAKTHSTDLYKWGSVVGPSTILSRLKGYFLSMICRTVLYHTIYFLGTSSLFYKMKLKDTLLKKHTNTSYRLQAAAHVSFRHECDVNPDLEFNTAFFLKYRRP